MRLFLSLLFVFLAGGVAGETLPGFRVETIASVPGFVSSVAAASDGTLYATTTNGWIHRIDGNQSVPVAALPTRAGGNGGLLGMAMLDDATAVVHYTTWDDDEDLVLDDVISEVELGTGAERVLFSFQCDIEFRERGVSTEHHGGNPTVAPDGTIFVGIGDYGVSFPAQNPAWNGGKIWRLGRDGSVQQFARGVRNPYDLAWDPELNRLVVADNGPEAGDEIHVVAPGDNLGWPASYGNDPPVSGSIAPAYVWPSTVAPTGLLRLNGANTMLPRGYLSAAFVTRSLYYFPDLVTRPIPHPVAVVDRFNEFILDVTQTPSGAIYFATAMGGASSIHRLHVPPRGDCNGDGLTDVRDIVPVTKEIEDGGSHPRITAQDGAYAGSWGCDANEDDVINDADFDALLRLVFTRRRAARH
jgi:glucose/arabinose dehydrogenase